MWIVIIVILLVLALYTWWYNKHYVKKTEYYDAASCTACMANTFMTLSGACYNVCKRN